MTKLAQNERSKERDDFSHLVQEHHRELLVYARSLTREDVTSRDIVQDSFIVAWQNKDKFDVTRDFGSWMRGIVRNKWRETLRKNSRLVSLDDEVLESMEADMQHWQSLRQDGGPSVFIKLEQCLKKLPVGLKDAIQHFYYQGSSTDEAADALGIGHASLRKRLQRARMGLKECVEK